MKERETVWRPFYSLRAHLDYVTTPFDVRCLTIWSFFKSVLRLFKTKSPPYSLPRIPPPDFVLRRPNSVLKVIKLSCLWYYMVSSRSVNEPLTPLGEVLLPSFFFAPPAPLFCSHSQTVEALRVYICTSTYVRTVLCAKTAAAFFQRKSLLRSQSLPSIFASQFTSQPIDMSGKYTLKFQHFAHMLSHTYVKGTYVRMSTYSIKNRGRAFAFKFSRTKMVTYNFYMLAERM